jgi:lipopolysaccharide export system protein LptA
MTPLLPRLTRTRLLLLAGAGLLGFSALTASAQISGKAEPIAYGADHTEANAKDHTFTYTGRVEMIQGEARLRADNIKVFTAPPRGDATANGWGAVERIVAEGNIYYVTPDQTMKGDHGVYTQGDNTMVLTGEVVLTQGQSLMTGNRLTYNSVTGQLTIDANPVNNAAKGRVRGVFYPDGQQPKPAAQPPKPQQ